jgi:hypothetical protein
MSAQRASTGYEANLYELMLYLLYNSSFIGLVLLRIKEEGFKRA